MVFYKGRCLLLLLSRHPAVRLSLWLMLVVFLQYASLLQMGAAGLLLLFSGHRVAGYWWRLVKRTLVLLLTLFLVFAYSLPGSEGVWEACQHVLRLLVLLGALAWLSAPMGTQAMMGGLWFLLRPLRFLGVPLDRSVVRLSLVLEDLDKQPARRGLQAWKEDLLLCEADTAPVDRRVCLELPRWEWVDSLTILLAALGLCGLGGLGGLSWLG